MANREDAHRAFVEALLADDAMRLYDRSPCGYLSTTPDGLIVKVNQTFLTWTGFTREELVGTRRFADLLNAGGRIYHETHYAPMLRLQDQVREIALDVVRADGDQIPVLVNAVLDRDEAGLPVVVRVALFDATERRGYERELLRARRDAEESEARAVSLARTLQQTLIPPRPPQIPGLEVAAAYRPAGDGREVGGDFYDVFQLAEGDWVLALGDVSGKGVQAAVVTSLIRYTVRRVAVLTSDPGECLRQLNVILRADDTDRFCTIVLMRVTRRGDDWHLRLSSGGHPSALLWRAGDVPVRFGAPGFLVGIFDDVEFTTSQVVLARGDSVFVHTDGVTEARRGAGFFGEARLLELMEQVGPDPDRLTGAVLEGVLAFQDQRANDDIAVLGLRVPEA